MYIMAEKVNKIGVTVHKCMFDNYELLCQPSVKVYLVDSRSGDLLIQKDSNNLTTHPCISFNLQNRPRSPSWEETLICDYDFCDISEKKSLKPMFFFEICDCIDQEHSKSKKLHTDFVNSRLAWAFLKPVGSDGSLNIEKPLRLQLYKVRKKCHISHQSCPIFHLYTEHGKKKFPGTVLVTINGVEPSSIMQFPNKEMITENIIASQTNAEIAENTEMPKIELVKWSRLPTQSCKLPNTKIADLFISNRGASCLSFSNSGMFLACGSFSKVTIIDVITLKTIGKLQSHTGLVYELSWSSDDSLLLTSSADCCAIIWNIHPLSTTPLHVLPHASFVYTGKWFVESSSLVTGGKDCILRYWVKSRSSDGFDLKQDCIYHEGYVTAVETSGQALMCSGDSHGVVVLWSLIETEWRSVRQLILREIAGAIVSNIHLHPGQRRIVVTAQARGSVMVDVSTGVVVQTYKAALEATRAATCLSPCGSLLLTFSQNNNVTVWEFDSGKLIAVYNDLFPDLSHIKTEISVNLAYHPFEHMAAFSVLGCNCPVVVLQFDREKDNSDQLGLIRYGREKNSPEITPTREGFSKETPYKIHASSGSGHLMEEKLAAIVRNIDRVLAAKREMIDRSRPGNDISSSK